MHLEGKECESIILTNRQRVITDHIVVDSVIAGRGFHWQKRIKIKVLGDIVIKLIGHSLFVINRIHLEDYLMCVATSEMGSNCPHIAFRSSNYCCSILDSCGSRKKNMNALGWMPAMTTVAKGTRAYQI